MEEKKLSVNDVQKLLNKKIPKERVQKGTEIETIPIICSTGSLRLDYALGCGGIPQGRILELFGPSSGGKSTISQIMLIEMQKAGYMVGIVDSEHSFSIDWFTKLGGDPEKLILAEVNSAKEAFDSIDIMASTKQIKGIMLDSISALMTESEKDAEYGDQNIALLARFMSVSSKKINSKLKECSATLLLINQIRHKIGGYGPSETTTGGVAVNFFASIRLDVRRGEYIGEVEAPVGFTTKIKVAKNKCGPPLRKVETDLYVSGDFIGIDNDVEIIDVAKELGIIQRMSKNKETDEKELIPDSKGSWYVFNDLIVYGKPKFIQAVKDDLKIFESVKDEVNKEQMKANSPEPKSFDAVTAN